MLQSAKFVIDILLCMCRAESQTKQKITKNAFKCTQSIELHNN